MKATCDICGNTSDDVHPGLVVWLAPLGQRYNAVNKCSDQSSCKMRVFETGEEWPVLDGPIRDATDTGQ